MFNEDSERGLVDWWTFCNPDHTEVHKGENDYVRKGGFLFCLLMVIGITFPFIYTWCKHFVFLLKLSSFPLRHFRNMMFSGSSIVCRFQKENAMWESKGQYKNRQTFSKSAFLHWFWGKSMEFFGIPLNMVKRFKQSFYLSVADANFCFKACSNHWSGKHFWTDWENIWKCSQPFWAKQYLHFLPFVVTVLDTLNLFIHEMGTFFVICVNNIISIILILTIYFFILTRQCYSHPFNQFTFFKNTEHKHKCIVGKTSNIPKHRVSSRKNKCQLGFYGQ